MKGRLGISVNKKSKEGGNAIIKLYAMADDRSANPCCFIWRLKNCKTSYSGNPCSPGKYQFLLFFSKNGRGVTDNIVRCILVKNILGK